MATAGKICIAEVEEIVPVGSLDPENIHLPSVYVDRIVKVEDPTKKIEFRTVTTPGEQISTGGKAWRTRIAKRAAKELKDGMYVNLGVGIPTLCSNFLEPDVSIIMQSENGILGLGAFPLEEEVDPDLINASKQTVSVIPGASYFTSSQSFAMIRGGHMDVTILGGMEVSAEGDLANWIIPGKLVKGMGGAMDLVAGARKTIITMEHTAKGNKKIFEKCRLPLTGERVVDMLITDKAVFEFHDGKMTLTEVAEDSSVEEVKANTDCQFEVADNIKTF